MGEYDYRQDLADCQALDDYYESLECDLDLERAASWTVLHRDRMHITFIDYNGEVRTIGAPYIDKAFPTNK